MSASKHSHLMSTEHCIDVLLTYTHLRKRIKNGTKYNIISGVDKPFYKTNCLSFNGIVFGKLQGREDLGDLDADGVIVIIRRLNNIWGE